MGKGGAQDKSSKELPETKAKNSTKPAELSEQEKRAIRDAFAIYDQNGDGVIQRSELQAVLGKLLGQQPTSAQLDKLLSQIDLDQSGTLDLEEFEKMMAARKVQKNIYKALFDRYDHDKDGYLSKAELMQALKASGKFDDETEVNDILESSDLSSEKIDYNRFLDYFI